MHIKNIFEERESEENSVSKESLLTANDGKNYRAKFYNLNLIISVGYRVKSINASRKRLFRDYWRRYKTTKIVKYIYDK